MSRWSLWRRSSRFGWCAEAGDEKRAGGHGGDNRDEPGDNGEGAGAPSDGAIARSDCRDGARARGWIFVRSGKAEGHRDRGRGGTGPRAVRSVCEEVRTGCEVISRGVARGDTSDPAPGGAELQQHLRAPEDGGEL